MCRPADRLRNGFAVLCVLLSGTIAIADDVSKAHVTGVVADEAGRPVAGATVRQVARGLATGPAAEVTTGPDGTFQLALDGPTARYENLAASADGGARLATHHFDSDDLSDPPPVRLTLRPARTTTVRVVNAAGAPVAGAGVEVFDGYGTGATATTDERGAAVVRVSADARAWYVLAAKPGVGLDYFENFDEHPNDRDTTPLPDEVRLVLNGAQTARVKAVDSTGKPLAGIPLRPWYFRKLARRTDLNVSGSRLLTARTGEDGVATFDYLPADLSRGRSGDAVPFLLASRDADGYHLPESPSYRPSAPEAELTARLLRNVRVGGTVTGANGQPAGGVLLQVEGRGWTNHYFRGQARTAADGSWHLDAYPEQTYIAAIIDGQWAAPNQYFAVASEADAPRNDVNFQLGEGTVVQGAAGGAGLTVTVVAHSPAGAKGPVRLREWDREGPSLVRWARSDAQGRYRVRLGKGTYDVYVQGTGGPSPPHAKVDVGDERTIVEDFETPGAAPQRVPLDGLVLDGPGGKPVRGAAVYGVTEDFGATSFDAMAGEDGRFRVHRLPRPVVLYARSPDGARAARVRLGPDDKEVTVALSEGVTATGRVLDPGGRPVAGADVRAAVVHNTPTGGRSHTFITATRTEKDGRYTLTGLPAGAQVSVHAYPAAKADVSWKEEAASSPLPATVGQPLNVPDLVLKGGDGL